MNFSPITSKENLTLAFNRLLTSRNAYYKRYFRPIYFMYNTALKQNIEDLHLRLLRDLYNPEEPTKIFIPKPSGLQRPITLLSIEDQIVYQAMANFFANKLKDVRQTVENKIVFSHILNRRKEKQHFLEKWETCYGRYCRKIEMIINSGKQWIAYFDLAAYYDTISHELLLKTVFPRGGNPIVFAKLLSFLKSWSSETFSTNYGHGIPQGPIASDFLAECFFLSTDLTLRKETTYVRYGDDIRLFGNSEIEVQRAALKLETLTRKLGLIPQAKKFEIKRVKSFNEIMKQLPSKLATSDDIEGGPKRIEAKKSYREFLKTLDGSPRRISDRTSAKFILFRAKPSQQLMNVTLRLMPRHPEHIDAFLTYFSRHSRSKRIIKECIAHLRSTPYEYVQGQIWEFLSERPHLKRSKLLRQLAVDVIRDKSRSFSVKLGAMRFLMEYDIREGNNYSKFLPYQNPALLRALLVPNLPIRFLNDISFMKKLYKRTSPEPGIMLAEALAENNISFSKFGINPRALPKQVQNVYRALHIISTPATSIDAIGEILTRMFVIGDSKKWNKIIKNKYAQAAHLLAQAESSYFTRMSNWLGYMDSFNDLLTRSILEHLSSNNMPGMMKTINKKNKLIPYGNLLDRNKNFSIHYAKISDLLRPAHERRNKLPQSHALSTDTGSATFELGRQERDKIKRQLKRGYQEILKEFSWI